MAGQSRAERQRIIDGYLNASGSNHFVPAHFLSWLRERPDHPAYDLFWGQDDETAAQAHREQLVRLWVNGLRIRVAISEPSPVDVGQINVREVTLPAMLSSMDGRRNGGGYMPVDPEDPATMAELRRQAARALEGWLDRHGGVAVMTGTDVTAINEITARLLGAAGDEVPGA